MLKIVHRGTHTEDASSPTIYVEALMETLVVYAYEGQNVAIFDVPGVYFNAYMPDDKDARLKLESTFLDIICGANPYHVPNILNKYGKKVLYLRIMNALYG